MKFPVDVQSAASSAGKMKSGERFRLTVGLVILGNIVLSFFLITILSPFGIHWLIPVSLQILLMVFVGIFLFRIFIFKEDEKLAEYSGNGSGSLAPYYKLRNTDSPDIETLRQSPVYIYELDNGSCSTVLRLRFGSNDESKSRRTREFYEEFYKTCGMNGLTVSEIVTTENFSSSEEYRRFLKDLSSVKDKNLSRSMMDIGEEVIEIYDEFSNVEVVNLVISTRLGYQRDKIVETAEVILRILEEYGTAFRSYGFLNKEEIIEFFKDFYGLEAIDLSLMRAEGAQDLIIKYSTKVSVYLLESEDGQVMYNRNKSNLVPLPKKIRG